MTARPFNTSTKQPTSVKLRVLNTSKAVTRQLEVDSRRMEERLRELKSAMNREKEERGSRGGSSLGIWASGAPGAITTHTNEMKKKKPQGPPMPGQTSKPKSGNKVRKIKVLKDTPIELPQRPKVKIGTTSRGDTKKAFKGPACGQCEQKAVALTCMECGENYCTACYAKFHMRGALKNHRSIPYQSPSASTESIQRPYENGIHGPGNDKSPPRRPPSSNSSSGRTGVDSHNPKQEKVVRIMVKSPAPTSSGGALLQGDYDEQESAAGFAAALAEWRTGKKTTEGPAVTTTQGASASPRNEGAVTTTQGASASPRAATISTSEGTSTANGNLSPRDIKINFTETSTLSYADRLLLKKHRRTELPETPSPRDGFGSSRSSGNPPSKEVLVNGDLHFSDDELEDEHQRYVDIFSKRVYPETPSSSELRPESSLSISEVTEDDEKHLEEATSYSVQEEPDSEPIIENPNNNNVQLSKSKVTTSKKSSAQQEKKAKTSQQQQDTTRKTSAVPSTKTSTATENTRNDPSKTSKASENIRNHSSTKSSRAQSRSSSKNNNNNPGGSQQATSSAQKNDRSLRASSSSATAVKSRAQSRSDSAASGKSDKSRMPQKSAARSSSSAKYNSGAKSSSAKTKSKGSADRDDEKCNTPTQERPQSVGLTTRPSDALIQASRHTQQPQHQYKEEGLTEFFMAGLSGENNAGSTEQTNRSPRSSVTPTNELPECSYQGGTAWRPDSSLAATPPDNQQKTFSPTPPSRRTSGNARTSGGARTPSSKTRAVRSPVKQIPRNPETGTPIENSSCMLWRNNRDDETMDSGANRQVPDERSSSRIEVDGKDMSEFDEDAMLTNREVSADDRETLEQLSWELASQEGRITADGRITSMSLLEEGDNHGNDFMHDAELGILQDDGHGSGLSTPCGDLMIEQEQLSEEDLQGDFEDNLHCREEVQALN